MSNYSRNLSLKQWNTALKHSTPYLASGKATYVYINAGDLHHTSMLICFETAALFARYIHFTQLRFKLFVCAALIVKLIWAVRNVNIHTNKIKRSITGDASMRGKYFSLNLTTGLSTLRWFYCFCFVLLIVASFKIDFLLFLLLLRSEQSIAY